MPKIYIQEIIDKYNRSEAELISSAETKYDGEVEELAKKLSGADNIKIVLLAGPSGSGKTTSANILKDKIIKHGRNAIVVSLDNFFKNSDQYPKLPNGEPDFENVMSLDIDKIHECLGEIIRHGKSVMPKFDFKHQRRAAETESVEISGGGLMIIEGIHALNPLISQTLPEENIFKVFVSVSTGIKNSKNTEIISGKQIRMLRRMIRDSLYRGFSVKNTLGVWPSVLNGENIYLYPYKHLADCKINTFHEYEPLVYEYYIRNNLAEECREAGDSPFLKIFDVLSVLPSISVDDVPETSLIREFIPGGVYEYLY